MQGNQQQDLIISGFSENTTQSSQISNDLKQLQFSAKNSVQNQDSLKQQLLENDQQGQADIESQEKKSQFQQFAQQQQHQFSQQHEQQHDDKLEPALIFNKNVPLWFKIILPILFITTTVLFVFSNSGIGASVMTLIQIGKLDPSTGLVKSFGLVNTIVDMWQAGVYPLSILIAAFSGVWPYAKIFLLTICILLNQRQLSFKKRERILVILDTMGKWSMIDAYVLILMFVAFYISQDNVLGLPVDFTVYADPGFGIYSFVAGTMASLIYTHIVMHYHRKQRAKIVPANFNERQHLGCVQPWRQYGVLFIMLMAVILFLVGSAIKTFQFGFTGAVTLIMPPDGIFTSYSMISLGTSIPNKTVDPNGAGIRFLQAMYFIFTLVVPLLFLIVLAVLWAIPLKIKHQQLWFVIAEILHAWSNVEVFIISVIVSLVEIGQFVRFIIGDKCDLINDWLEVLSDYGIINLNGDNSCYDTKIELQEGCILLFTAAVLYFILGTAILRHSQKNLQKRLSQFDYQPQVSFLGQIDDEDDQQDTSDLPQETRNTISEQEQSLNTNTEQYHQSRQQPMPHPTVQSNISSDIFQSEADNPLGIQGANQQSSQIKTNFNFQNIKLDHIKEAPLSFLERSDPLQ